MTTPPRRQLFSKYAWKTIGEAMGSNAKTIRLTVMVSVFITMATVMPAITICILRGTMF